MRNNSDLWVLIYPTFSSSNFLFDILSQIHIHLWKENVQLTVFIINMICLHHIWTMCTLFSFLYFIKSLQNSDFTLFKCFFLCVKLSFELFYCIYLPCFDISTFVNVSETSSTYYIVLLIYTTKQWFRYIRRPRSMSSWLICYVIIMWNFNASHF